MFGRLRGQITIADDLGAEWLPVGLEHVRRLHDLPLIHRDPFDRILIAQAFAEGLTLLTVDSVMPQYGVPILPGT